MKWCQKASLGSLAVLLCLASTTANAGQKESQKIAACEEQLDVLGDLVIALQNGVVDRLGPIKVESDLEIDTDEDEALARFKKKKRRQWVRHNLARIVLVGASAVMRAQKGFFCEDLELRRTVVLYTLNATCWSIKVWLNNLRFETEEAQESFYSVLENTGEVLKGSSAAASCSFSENDLSKDRVLKSPDEEETTDEDGGEESDAGSEEEKPKVHWTENLREDSLDVMMVR